MINRGFTHRSRGLGLALALPVFAISFGLAPGRAFAQASYAESAGLALGAASLCGALLIPAVADFVSYGMGSPWDDGWAGFDVVVGSLGLAGGLAFAIVDWAAGGFSLLAGLGLIATGLGAHLLGHGVWSFERNDRAGPSVAFVPWATPTDGGLVVSVTR